MTQFTLGVADICSATGWGVFRVRSAVRKPYPLQHEQQPTGPQGGNRERRYRLADLLSRCRCKRPFTEEHARALFAIDQARRHPKNKDIEK